MCIGILPTERLTRAKASGPGNLVVLYGATTGRDGIGGASVLASQELGEDDADKRPSVQVGDPFTGKKLIESSLELVESGLVESLQDCGAAGLASALSEMASNGVGIDVHLDRVPLREDGMEPWEIMISESQERMVAVVRAQMLDAVRAVCERWELPCTVIGEVTEGGQLRCFHEDDVVGDVPARFLTDEAPRYTVATRRREPAAAAPLWGPESHPQALVELLRSPNIRSKRWIYEQYDHLVGSRTVRRPGFDGAVLRLRSGNRGLAVSLDGQGRICSLDPRTGGALAILESARNVACAGGTPLAFTDCLNFGNPEKPEQAWELAEAIEGMAEACEALGLPIVSGNVSLYNETDGRPIHPTPVVGCVGLVADVTRDPVDVAGRRHRAPRRQAELSLDGSEYQALYGELAGRPAKLDLRAEATLIMFLAKVAPHVSLLHDCAEGGLAVALAECAIVERDRRRRRAAAGCRAPVRRGRRPGDRRVRPDVRRFAARRAAAAPRRRRRRCDLRRAAGRAARGLGEPLMCGVFGIRSLERDIARITYFGLFALQHRGQESAGIAVSDRGRLTVLRDMGLVSQVFDEQNLSGLQGEAAIGHTRYSTTGSTDWANAQPLIHHGRARTIALGHNGNLTNATELRAQLAEDGVKLSSTSDSELIAALIANDDAPLDEAVAGAMRRLEGAFSIVALSEGNARRVPRSARLSPARARTHRGRMGRRVRDVRARPRRRRAGARGRSRRARADRRGRPALGSGRRARRARRALHLRVLLPRTARLAAGGRRGARARVRMGERLAAEAPVEADLVLGIPDSGIPAAVGFSRALNIPFSEGLIKNRYVGRTFIQPSQEMRRQGARMKYHPVAEVAGKRVVAVDDSIVRGNTTRQIVQMLFDAGATEVHVRISSPPVIGQCFYGIDLADPAEMIASDRTVEEIREHIGATSLAYISLEGLQASTQRPASQLCRACLTRDYPTAIPTDSKKLKFEPARV